MSKRSATETFAASEEQPFPKATLAGAKRRESDVDEMGEFEDDLEDELDEDEERDGSRYRQCYSFSAVSATL